MKAYLVNMHIVVILQMVPHTKVVQRNQKSVDSKRIIITLVSIKRTAFS